MVYLTPSQRSAFKSWAFTREKAMSDVLYEGIVAVISAPETDRPSVEFQLSSTQEHISGQRHLRDHADRFAAIATDLAQMLWGELEKGAQLPAVAAEVGLSTEQVRHLLATYSLPVASRGADTLPVQD